MLKNLRKTPAQKLREQLSALATKRTEIIEASTARKLELIAQQEASVRAALLEAERAESIVKSASKPSESERDLWSRIRENMDKEQNILREVGSLPSKYIRPDAAEHFVGVVTAMKAELAVELSNLKSHQSMGPRLRARVRECEALEATLPRLRPLCVAGERVHALRAERERLTAEREALRTEREAAALATV